MAKVLFINPMVREEDDPHHVPMGMAQLCSIAINKGHQVQVYDHNAWRSDDDTTKKVIESDKWDLIAVGGITTAYASIKKIVKLSKKIFPNTPISLGGGVLTSIPKEVLTWLPEVDFGFVGESYKTIIDVLSMIDERKSEWHKIKGLVVRVNKNDYYFTPPQDLIKNLDDLPYPAFDLFPLEEVYFKNSKLLYSVSL